MSKSTLLRFLFRAFLIGMIPTYFLQAQNDIPYYIAKAEANSPLIKDNQNQEEANAAEIKRLRAFYTKPQVGVTANYLLAPILSKDQGSTTLQLTPTTATDYYGYEFGVTNGGQYQALVGVSQPLLNQSRYKVSADQMRVATQINQNQTVLTRHDLSKIVTDQYILCLQDQRQIAFLEQMLEFIKEQQAILDKLIQSSIYKKSDGITLSIDYQNYTGQLQAAKAAYQRDFLDLNIVCGIDDTQIIALKEVALRLDTNTPDGGFLKKYTLDSLSLDSQQKVTELKYKPSLNLFANTGLNAVNVNHVFDRFGMSAGLSLSIPIFDGSQRKITRTKTKLLQNSIASYRSNFEVQNSVRKANLLKELQTYPDRRATMEEQLHDYELLLDTYKKEIMMGQLSIINYSTAIRNKLILQNDYNRLITQEQLLINTYNYWNW